MEEKIIILKVGNPEYPTNCYIVSGIDKNSVIIDPGMDAQKIINKISECGLKVNKIFLTHCHADHISALSEVLAFTDASVYIHKNDIDGVLGEKKAYFEELGLPMHKVEKSRIILVNDGDIIREDDLEFEFIHTPGHTNGSMCIFEKKNNVLFTGDTIFHNCYGRCDLISGSIEDMGKSLDKLFNRFNDILIYPRS